MNIACVHMTPHLNRVDYYVHLSVTDIYRLFLCGLKNVLNMACSLD